MGCHRQPVSCWETGARDGVKGSESTRKRPLQDLVKSHQIYPSSNTMRTER